MKKILLLAACIWQLATGLAQETRQLAVDKPQAIADLKITEGAALVNAKWYVQPAHIEAAEFKSPGPSSRDPLLLYPTGMVIKTHTIHPQIGTADFDKSFIEIKPTDLETREGMGLVSFAWYRVDVTIPATIGKLAVIGTTLVFEIVVDDYSEIWLNGKQMQGFGKIPDNYIWVRNAVIDFYKELPTNPAWKNIGKIYTVDKKLNSIITTGTTVDKVADGFQFTEGPVWHPDGYLLFSDPNTNTIYRYNPKSHNVTVYMSHSGYTGADIG